MMDYNIASTLMGAVAMASLVAMLFFVKFWSHTRDSFFLLFAAAFGIDAVSRLVLSMFQPSGETEPIAYLSRLIMFTLIVLAIVQKNRPGRQEPK